MRRRDFLLTAGSVCAAGSFAPAAAQRPTATIRLGAIGISFHAVVAGVVRLLLERLGARVDITTAPHDAMFRRLGAGEVDLLAAAWMPGTHSHLFTPIAERIERVATVYSDARLFWAVPSYIPAEAIASVEDLLRPDVAARMDKSIRSIGPTAGLSLRSLQAVEAYGLAAAGYRVLPGETEDWVRGFREAYAAQRWIVMPLWQPHFLNRTHELRMLRDPLRALGGADDAVIVANRESFGGLPARMRRALQAVAIGLDGVTEMDLAVNLRGISPRQAAAEWMEANRQRVQEWTA